MWNKYETTVQKLKLELALQNSVPKLEKCIINGQETQIFLPSLSEEL